jgi:group I intron endonuclease
MANSGLNKSGIYKMISLVHPDRVYVGSANNLRHRKNSHFYCLKKGTHKNPKLQAHYNKYGEDDLIFIPIAICDKSELIPINGIVWIEQFFIDSYKPWFNIALIAGSSVGIKRTLEQIEKQKQKKLSEETKKLCGLSNIGRIPWNKGLTKETSLIIAKVSSEHGDKIRGRPSKQKGTKRSKEVRKRISEGHIGLKDTEETKRRKSEAGKGKHSHSIETRNKLRIANLGKKKPPMTEENKKNLSVAMQKWWNERKKDKEAA